MGYFRRALQGVIFFSLLIVYNTFRLTGLTELPEPPNFPCHPQDVPAMVEATDVTLNCHIIHLQRVCMESNPPPAKNSSKIWPGFIGIGPARSGSSNLLWSLEQHPNIQVGDPALQNQSCCPGSELQFFSNDDLFIQGMDFYKGFFGPRKPNALIAGEKTPTYSDHPLVPHRILAMLGPHVKFIFTLRDPMEALLSLYSLRKQEKKVNVSYWFNTLLEDQAAYEACVRKKMRHFRRIENSSPLDLFEALGRADIHSARMLDEITYVCWGRPTVLRGQHERLQHYIYKENLIRWRTIFSGQILCVWSDEFRSKGIKTINRILRFLGLEPMPSDFISINYFLKREQKRQWKNELGPLHRKMCDFLLERNKGIEKICPRMWPGKWEWCADAPLASPEEAKKGQHVE